MDYIREELLRQRAVLARLLLGRTAEEAEREENAVAETDGNTEHDLMQAAEQEFFQASRALAAGERFRRSESVAQRADEEYWEVSESLFETLPEGVPYRKLGEDGMLFGSRLHREADTVSGARYTLSGKGEAGNRRKRIGAERAYRGRRFLAAESDTPAVEYTVEEAAVPFAGETADARELSRIFQRDARRYDGGFTLY